MVQSYHQITFMLQPIIEPFFDSFSKNFQKFAFSFKSNFLMSNSSFTPPRIYFKIIFISRSSNTWNIIINLNAYDAYFKA